MFVALDQSQIIGFIAGHRSTRMGCLAELQRQGIGAQLLSLLQAWFRSHQATRVIVDAAPNSPYRAFYIKHGAIPLDRYWLYWPDISQCRI